MQFILYTLKEFSLLRYLKYSEMENAIGKKLGFPETVEKPEFEVIIRVKKTDHKDNQ